VMRNLNLLNINTHEGQEKKNEENRKDARSIIHRVINDQPSNGLWRFEKNCGYLRRIVGFEEDCCDLRRIMKF
jgi:hypothetical protein